MTQRMIVDGLWCGQGMANIIRIYKDQYSNPATTAPDWLCVFDFGAGGLSQSKKALGVTPPVAFIMEQLQLQKAAGRDPKIDLMLISHQDRDHWALLAELDAQIVQKGLNVSVGRMLLAGLNWRLSSKNAVLKFAKRACGYNWYDAQYSSYDDPNNPGAPIEIGDARMRMMITNVATNDSKEDIERNCSSAMALVQLGQMGFVFPGDATWETLLAYQQITKKWTNNPLPFVYAASVPHHGAFRTMNSGTVGSPNLDELIWFTNYIKPRSIFASAGIKNSHSHPYKIILEKMGVYAFPQQFQARPIVVYDGGDDKWKQLENVKENIYTTVLNLVSPAKTANWIFNVTPSSTETAIQLYNAGIPGILSAPALSQMELTAQRINAQQEDSSSAMVINDDFASRIALRQEPDFPFPRSDMIWGGAVTYQDEAPTRDTAMRAAPNFARTLTQPVNEATRAHAPLPTAGAPPLRQRGVPPRRVRPQA